MDRAPWSGVLRGKKEEKKAKKKRKKGKDITCLLLREGTNRKAERIMMIKREKKI